LPKLLQTLIAGKNGTVTEPSEPSEPADPNRPVDYAAPPPAGESPRPTSVTVLAAIGIVIGSLGLLCKPAGTAMQLLIKLPQPNPVFDLFQNDPALRNFLIGNAVTGTLLSLLLLMSSLGSLRLKPWARTGMLAYAFLAILMTLVGQAVGLFIIGPQVEQVMRQSGMPQPPGAAIMSGWRGAAVGLAIGLWYPALILVFYTRARAKEAFERGLPKTSGI
jgi:hypothetical protein